MEVQTNQAGFGRRFVAWIIDTIILVPGSFILFMAFYYPTAEWGQGDLLAVAIRTDFILFIALCIHFTIFWRLVGRTPGKMAVKIKVVRSDGSHITTGRAIIRSVILVAPVFIIYTVIYLIQEITAEAMSYVYLSTLVIILCHFFMIILDKKKRSLHDRIAGTLVIKTS